MKKECRFKLMIERGYTYDKETGLIYSKYGNVRENKSKSGYVFFGIKYKNKVYNIYGHQFAWYFVYGECASELDHINGVRSDNRIVNLRSVTKSQNQRNRISAKGYYWNKQMKKWYAQISVGNKSIYLGLFSNEEDARKSYLEAKKIYHL